MKIKIYFRYPHPNYKLPIITTCDTYKISYELFTGNKIKLYKKNFIFKHLINTYDFVQHVEILED